MTHPENNQINHETNDYWWANVCHISSIAGYIIVDNLSFMHIFNFKFAFSFWHSITTNIINLLLPIIIWKYKKSLSNFIDRHGKSVINFQLFLLGYRSLFWMILYDINLKYSSNFINEALNSLETFSDILKLDMIFLIEISFISLYWLFYILLYPLHWFFIIQAIRKIQNSQLYKYPLSINLLKY